MPYFYIEVDYEGHLKKKVLQQNRRSYKIENNRPEPTAETR